MVVAMTVLFGEKLHYLSFPTERQIEISDKVPADMTIPGLGLSIYVSWARDAFRVNTVQNNFKKTITTPLDKPTVIDSERKIALFFSKELREVETFQLDFDGEYYFGRSTKKSSAGKENDVVIDMPFVSGFHFRVKRRGGETEITDLGSTNGLYLNGEMIRTAKMRDGDIAYIMTIRVQLRGDMLLFYNVGTHFHRKKTELVTEDTGRVQFERSPRIQERLPGERLNSPLRRQKQANRRSTGSRHSCQPA